MQYFTVIKIVRARLGEDYASAIEEALAAERYRYGLILAAIDARYYGGRMPSQAFTHSSSEHCDKLLCLFRENKKS